MQSLREFLNDKLTAVAEEIYEAVEKTIIEYKEEIFRSKELEITHLRMQLKLLTSDPGCTTDMCLEDHLLQPPRPDHPPPPAAEEYHQSSPAEAAPQHQYCEEDGDSSVEQEHPESSQIKAEPQKTPKHFWIDQDGEPLEALESDIKLISSPSGLKPSLQEQALHVHPFLNISDGEESKGKPYSCPVCKKRFSNCSHLSAHIRTHTGERPYRCEICRKRFITTSALNRHQTIHTEGKQFICTYCGKSFKWMESLGRHIRSAHKGDNTAVLNTAD
ncbi:putative zinc finger protein 705E [Oryzias latipes]|nr:putative zinc finger protein 705E [Oryzias latipes]